MVGGRSKKIVGALVVGKTCRICEKAEASNKEVPHHECPKIFDGTAKSMEADAAIELVKDAWQCRFFISRIVCDDDSSLRANLQHSWRKLIEAGKMREDEWPRTEKNYRKRDYGQLPLHIPAPTFLADPTHRIKVFAKYLFKLAKKPGSKCGRGEALQMKRYIGYWLKKPVQKHLKNSNMQATHH